MQLLHAPIAVRSADLLVSEERPHGSGSLAWKEVEWLRQTSDVVKFQSNRRLPGRSPSALHILHNIQWNTVMTEGARERLVGKKFLAGRK
jgi:hypothetical protein